MQDDHADECDGQRFWIKSTKNSTTDGRWKVQVKVGELPEITDDYTYETLDEARDAGRVIGRGIIQDE